MATSLTKEDWINQFLVLSHWAEAKGYEVVLKTDGEDSVCFENKRILIDSRSWPESKFYTLLHECGHLLIYQNRKSFQKDSLISEELIAWKKGRGLARRLGLHIDKSRYDNTMVEAIMTYIDMASRRT